MHLGSTSKLECLVYLVVMGNGITGIWIFFIGYHICNGVVYLVSYSGRMKLVKMLDTVFSVLLKYSTCIILDLQQEIKRNLDFPL